MNSDIFDRLSFLSLFLVVVLLPIFCLPFTRIPVETSKGLLLVLGLALTIIFWAIARFMDGKITFPKSWLLVSGFGIVLAFLLSALVAPNSQVSLFGTMFDIGSFWFIFAGFILMLMCAVVFRTPKQVKIVLLWTILSSTLVIVFQIAHIFFPAFLSMGILANKTSNVLGSWNALGLFAGFSTLMFLLVIEFFSISKKEKLVLQIFILLSLFLMAAVNFPLVWIFLGISSLIIFVYKVSITLPSGDDEEKKKNFPGVSFVVVMISLLFFLNPLISVSSGYLGDIIPGRLGISNAEISPSFGATMSITKNVLVKHPVFGLGPNRFGEAWAMYKPAVINNTAFWNVSFDSGSGLLPTLAATTGAIGILSWFVFLVLFLISGVKSVFSGIKKGINWEIMAFFVLSLYLFISAMFYSTGSALFLLALAFTGSFIGLVTFSSKEEANISFLNDHRKSFFSIMALLILIVLALATAFKYIERFVSVAYFGKTLSATTEPVAEENIGTAISLYSNDLYLRTYSQVFLTKLSTLANKEGTLSGEEKMELQASFDQAIKSAQMATEYNTQNYLNFQLLGSVYQTVGSLGVKDGYSNAVLVYQNASNLNPLNPGLKLAMAGASFADGKIREAKEYANAALTLKPDYFDALITLSRIAKSENNNTLALSYAQAALKLDPSNKDLIAYISSLNNSSPASTTTENPKQ